MKLGSSASIRLRALCVLCISSFSFSPSSFSQSSPRPITLDDISQIQAVHDPQLSPDSRWVAYAVDKTLVKEDKTETRLWMIPFSGGDAIPLTAEGVSSTHPRWSPDGKFLAFLSARNGGKTQVWLLNRLGGEAQRLTDTVQDVQDFSWSPDGRRLALVLRDPSPEELAAAKSNAQTAAHSSEASDSESKVQSPKTKRPWIIDRLQFKQDEVATSTAAALTSTSSLFPLHPSRRSLPATSTIPSRPGLPTQNSSPSPAIAPLPTPTAPTTPTSGPSRLTIPTKARILRKSRPTPVPIPLLPGLPTASGSPTSPSSIPSSSTTPRATSPSSALRVAKQAFSRFSWTGIPSNPASLQTASLSISLRTWTEPSNCVNCLHHLRRAPFRWGISCASFMTG